MKKLLLAFVMLVCGFAVAENLRFIGETDKNPVLYKVDEEMVFTIQLVDADANNAPVDGRKLNWVISCDDGMVCRGEAVSSADAPLVLKTKMMHPGFVRVLVNVCDENGQVIAGDSHKFDGGAGANVNDIPLCAEPEDFDAFWDDVKAKLYATPYEAKLTKVESDSTPDVDVFKYEFAVCFGSDPATGLIGIPKNAQPGSLKMLVTPYAYGFNRPYVDNERVAKEGLIHLVPTRWAEDPTMSDEEYKAMYKELDGKAGFRNLDDKYGCDLFKMLERDLRAVQYAMSRPEWNGKDITCKGGSMGAFQSVSIAALVPQVNFLDAFIPWVCDLNGRDVYRRMSGWRPNGTSAMAYCDTANMAKRVSCPVKMAIGLGDYVCPPSGTIIAYRNFKGPKSITIYQNFGHGSPFGPKVVKYDFEGDLK